MNNLINEFLFSPKNVIDKKNKLIDLNNKLFDEIIKISDRNKIQSFVNKFGFRKIHKIKNIKYNTFFLNDLNAKYVATLNDNILYLIAMYLFFYKLSEYNKLSHLFEKIDISKTFTPTIVPLVAPATPPSRPSSGTPPSRPSSGTPLSDEIRAKEELGALLGTTSETPLSEIIREREALGEPSKISNLMPRARVLNTPKISEKIEARAIELAARARARAKVRANATELKEAKAIAIAEIAKAKAVADRAREEEKRATEAGLREIMKKIKIEVMEAEAIEAKAELKVAYIEETEAIERLGIALEGESTKELDALRIEAEEAHIRRVEGATKVAVIEAKLAEVRAREAEEGKAPDAESRARKVIVERARAKEAGARELAARAELEVYRAVREARSAEDAILARQKAWESADRAGDERKTIERQSIEAIVARAREIAAKDAEHAKVAAARVANATGDTREVIEARARVAAARAIKSAEAIKTIERLSREETLSSYEKLEAMEKIMQNLTNDTSAASPEQLVANEAAESVNEAKQKSKAIESSLSTRLRAIDSREEKSTETLSTTIPPTSPKQLVANEAAESVNEAMNKVKKAKETVERLIEDAKHMKISLQEGHKLTHEQRNIVKYTVDVTKEAETSAESALRAAEKTRASKLINNAQVILKDASKIAFQAENIKRLIEKLALPRTSKSDARVEERGAPTLNAIAEKTGVEESASQISNKKSLQFTPPPMPQPIPNNITLSQLISQQQSKLPRTSKSDARVEERGAPTLNAIAEKTGVEESASQISNKKSLQFTPPPMPQPIPNNITLSQLISQQQSNEGKTTSSLDILNEAAQNYNKRQKELEDLFANQASGKDIDRAILNLLKAELKQYVAQLNNDKNLNEHTRKQLELNIELKKREIDAKATWMKKYKN